MEALAIVTCTLLGFAALLFGSDSLDRRLTLRSRRLPAESATTQGRALPAPVAVDVVAAPAEDGKPVRTVPALSEPAAA